MVGFKVQRQTVLLPTAKLLGSPACETNPLYCCETPPAVCLAADYEMPETVYLTMVINPSGGTVPGAGDTGDCNTFFESSVPLVLGAFEGNPDSWYGEAEDPEGGTGCVLQGQLIATVHEGELCFELHGLYAYTVEGTQYGRAFNSPWPPYTLSAEGSPLEIVFAEANPLYEIHYVITE